MPKFLQKDAEKWAAAGEKNVIWGYLEVVQTRGMSADLSGKCPSTLPKFRESEGPISILPEGGIFPALRVVKFLLPRPRAPTPNRIFK